MYWGLSVQWVKMAEVTEPVTEAGESGQSNEVRARFPAFLTLYRIETLYSIISNKPAVYSRLLTS